MQRAWKNFPAGRDRSWPGQTCGGHSASAWAGDRAQGGRSRIPPASHQSSPRPWFDVSHADGNRVSWEHSHSSLRGPARETRSEPDLVPGRSCSSKVVADLGTETSSLLLPGKRKVPLVSLPCLHLTLAHTPAGEEIERAQLDWDQE